MKALIKLLVALAIANAAARVGLATARYYQLKDASQEILTFGAQTSPDEIRNAIYRKAQTLNVPLGLEDVEVSRDALLRTTARASYTEGVEVFPSFTYPIDFRFSVEGVSLTGLTAPPPRR